MSNLQEHVSDWINETAADSYDGDREAVVEDLMYGGCQSGMVGHLIYYCDTIEFYDEHQSEIDALLAELIDSTGMQPAELFGDSWDDSDPLARDRMNKNLLAWFGFEETARNIT